MAGHIVTPTVESVSASSNFSSWLRRKRLEKGLSQIELADDLDLDRKSLIAYEQGQRVPKLDVLAKIYAYFEEKEIRISLY